MFWQVGDVILDGDLLPQIGRGGSVLLDGLYFNFSQSFIPLPIDLGGFGWEREAWAGGGFTLLSATNWLSPGFGVVDANRRWTTGERKARSTWR